MADKQQNITVNYKFNVADVERASATLSRANQASNQLQQAGQKAGQSISQGFGQARRSITSMETELTRLKTMVEVSSDPKRTAALSAEYKNLALQVRAAKKELLELPKEQKKVTEAAKSNTQAFGGLLNAAKAYFTLAAARQTLTLALDMAELAGNVEGVSRAFQRAVPDSVQMLNSLRRATHGTVSDVELMQKALQAQNLGVPIQEIATFFDFAAIRAQQTGVSVEYLTESIVNGLGRKSTRVLDNLGISASRIKEEFHGVSLEQLSVAEVSRGLGNIIRDEMGKMGEYVETSKTKVEQLRVTWTTLREEIGKRVTQDGGLIDFLKLVVDYYARLNEAKNKDISLTELNNQKRIESIAAISDESFAINALTGSREENISTIETEIQRLTSELGVFAKQRQAAIDRIKTMRDEYDEFKRINGDRYLARVEFEKQIDVQEKIRDGDREAIAIDQEILKLLLARLAALKQINEQEVGPQTGIIERKKKEIEDLEQSILKTNDAANLTQINIDKDGNATMQVGRLVQKLEIAKAELADLQRVFSDIDVKPLKARIKEASDDFLDFEANIKRIENSIQELNLAPRPADTVAQLDTFWTNMGEMWNENWRNLVADSADFQANAINSMLESEVRAMDSQIAGLKAHYKQRQDLAGDNERAKSELRIKEDREVQRIQKAMFEREKRIRRAQTVVDGAAAAIKAFATAPNVYIAIAQAALIAATTIEQLRVIDKEQPRFAKGVINLQGPGTGTSDSIPARLSKGESVMTAWETKYAGDVLKDVRAKRLDNKVLRDLKQRRERPVITPVHDDSKIIAAIEANKPPDVVEQSNIVYEVRQHSDTLRRKQRSKSMNI